MRRKIHSHVHTNSVVAKGNMEHVTVLSGNLSQRALNVRMQNSKNEKRQKKERRMRKEKREY